MRRVQNFLVVIGCLAVLSFSAQAASVSDQIVSAIAKGDYKTVQALVGNHPGTTGKAENALLSSTLDKLISKPQEAAVAMTVASSMTAGIKPADAASVAQDLRKIVKTIADKALLICNPETNANTGELNATADPKKVADAKAIASILDSAEAIAQTPAIVAIDPQLFAQIQAQSDQCETGDDALLAQKPNFRPQTILPHLQNPGFPPPNKHQASPD